MSHLIYKEYKLVRHMGMNLYKITRDGSGKVPEYLQDTLYTSPLEAHKDIDKMSKLKPEPVRASEGVSEAPKTKPKAKPKAKKKETKKED